MERREEEMERGEEENKRVEHRIMGGEEKQR